MCRTPDSEAHPQMHVSTQWIERVFAYVQILMVFPPIERIGAFTWPRPPFTVDNYLLVTDRCAKA